MRTIITAACLLIACIVNAQTFSAPIPIEANGQGANPGIGCSQLIVNGNPAMCFYDVVHGDLRFVRANDPSGTTWGNQIIVDHVSDVGRYCDMQIVQGVPAIVYLDITLQRVLYIRANDPDGNSWGNRVQVDYVAGEYPYHLSLNVVNGNPAVSFCESMNLDVKYVRAFDNIGTTWSTAQYVVTTGMVGYVTELMIVNGNPGIVYNNATTAAIYFLRATDANGFNWGTPVPVTAPGDNAYELSCDFSGGKLAIAYYSNNLGGLRFVIANDSNGTTWQSPIILESGAGNGRFSTLVNASGYLMVAYLNPALPEMRFVRCLDTSGSSWSSPVTVLATGVDEASSMTICNGNPAIAWTQSGNPMRFVRASDPLGNTWGTPISFRVPRSSGRSPSLLCVVGKPAVFSSTYGSNGKLLFNQCSDSIGQTWDTSQTFLQTSIVGAVSSAEIVNGVPAACYYYTGLKYIRALDSLGTAWSNPIQVDSGGSFIEPILLDLNGKPAIVYYNNSVAELRFTVATDSNGTSWMTHVIPVAGISDYHDAMIINGKPAIAFSDSNGDLFYVTSTDSLGQVWPVPTLVDAVADAYENPGLSIVNNCPAIMYNDANTNLVKFALALNVNGTSWGSPANPTTNGYGGFNFNMIDHMSRPVAVFTDGSSRVLFTSANDSLGSSPWNNEVIIGTTSGGFEHPDIVSLPNGYVGVAYYVTADKFAYYSYTCIPPLNPPTSGSIAICSGDSTTITSSGYGTLSWYSAPTGGQYLGSGNAFSTGPLTSSTTFYVQDSTCAASTRTAVVITVNPPPTLTMSGNTTICLGDSTTLSITGNGDGFNWSTGSTNMSETFTPTITSNEFVSTYDGNGCVTTINFTVTVIQPITTNNPVTICSGDSYSVGNNTYSAAGTYTDSLQNVNGCDSVVITTLTLQPNIDTAVTYSIGTLTSAETGATSYQWINCQNMQTISGATNQNYIPTQNGNYAVIVVNGPCADTSACINVTDVGVSEQQNSELALNCLVSNGAITAWIDSPQNQATLDVYDAVGKLIYSSTCATQQSVLIPIEASGLYLVKATVGGNAIVTRVIAAE